MAGHFCWVELLTSDLDAAQVFYRDVMGWTCAPTGMTDREYHFFSYDGQGVGGLMLLPEEAKAQGARPNWTGYIATDNVEADAAATLAAGGRILRAPETLPGMGQFAVLADPQGAVFSLWRDMSGREHTEIEPMAIGHVGWHELYANDVAAAFAFYAERFGWTSGEALDMGPMGVYQLFATAAAPVGGMMRRPEHVPHPFWNYYFTVAALDAAMDKATKGGGKIVNGPMEVPGGAWIANCFDPQGAFFSMVAAKR